MTTGVLLTPPIIAFTGNDGRPAVNGTVLTQVGGVNTATFQDSGLTTPLPNPIPLNSRGEISTSNGVSSQCFLTPNTVYTFTLFDSSGNQLWTATYVNGVQVTLTQAVLGPVIYPQTLAETTALVVPVNYIYPPGSVDRYGTNTVPGTTDMTTAFQAAVNQARDGGMDVTFGQTGMYRLTSPIDMTFSGNGSQYGLNIRQIGGGPATNFPPGTRGGILADHGGYTVFDTTGCLHFTFYDISVITRNGGTYPKTCFLTARNSTGESNLPRFYNTTVTGWFSNCILYNYASEDGVYVGNCWFNYATDANSKVVRLTSTNISALTSSFVTIFSGSQSTTDHEFLGGQLAHLGGAATSDVFELDAITGLKLYGQWMHAGSNSSSGRSYIYVNTTNGASAHIRMRDIVGEDAAFYPQYCVFIDNTTVVNINDWAIVDCYLPNLTNPIFGSANTTLFNFNVQNITQQAGHSLACTNAKFSTLNGGSTLGITISGTSTNNLIMAVLASISIGTRNGDYIIDVSSGGSQAKGNAFANNLIATAAAGTVSAGQVSYGATLATTASIGANGAPPAQVAGYIIINVNGTQCKLPYYNN